MPSCVTVIGQVTLRGTLFSFNPEVARLRPWVLQSRCMALEDHKSSGNPVAKHDRIHTEQLSATENAESGLLLAHWA